MLQRRFCNNDFVAKRSGSPAHLFLSLPTTACGAVVPGGRGGGVVRGTVGGGVATKGAVGGARPVRRRLCLLHRCSPSPTGRFRSPDSLRVDGGRSSCQCEEGGGVQHRAPVPAHAERQEQYPGDNPDEVKARLKYWAQAVHRQAVQLNGGVRGLRLGPAQGGRLAAPCCCATVPRAMPSSIGMRRPLRTATSRLPCARRTARPTSSELTATPRSSTIFASSSSSPRSLGLFASVGYRRNQ